MSLCPKCGKESREGDLFCLACGTPIAPADDVMEDALSADLPDQEDMATVKDSLQEPQKAVSADAPAYAPADKTPAYASSQPLVDKTFTFRNTGIGLIVIGMLMAFCFVAGIFTPLFYLPQNLFNMLYIYTAYALIAMSVVVSVRARGLDLSIGAVASLSGLIVILVTSSGGSWLLGFGLAVMAACLIGLINGIITVWLRAPAVIVTLAMAAVIGRFSVLYDGTQMTAGLSVELGRGWIGSAIFLGGCFIIVFLITVLSKLGKPSYKRDKKDRPLSYLFAYVISSGIAAVLAGFFPAARYVWAMPAELNVYLLFVFALVIMSRAFDNRWVPAVFALIPALIWTLLTNLMALWSLPTYYRTYVFGGLMLLCIIVAFLSKYEKRQKIMAGSIPTINM